MSETLSSLLNLLGQEHEIYCDLLKSSDSKRKAIVEGNVDELDRIVSEEEKMIESINVLEKQREELVAAKSAELGIAPEELTLDRWPSEDDLLQTGLEKQAALKETLSELDRNNQINARLIEVHLEYIDYLFEAATSTTETTAYAADGTVEARKNQASNLFDETM